MTESAHQPTFDYVDIADFDAVEALEAASSEVGWQLEYRQLDAGSLHVSVGVREHPDGLVAREVVSRRLEVVGETPPGEMTIHSVIQGRMLVNGLEVSEGRVVVVPPSHDFLLVGSDSLDAITLHVAQRDFFAYLEPPACKWRALARAVEGVEVAGDWAARLASPRFTSRSDGVFALTSEVVAATRGGRGEIAGVEDIRASLERARQYIDAHLSDSIRMPDLARHTGIGVRRLQRLFRRELVTTVSGYVRARRLENVRRELIDPLLRHETIATIAALNGFSHPGRFAAAFRAHYGETPREWRRRSGGRQFYFSSAA